MKLRKHIALVVLGVMALLFWCEIAVYYLVLHRCSWPASPDPLREDGLKTLILADTHLLGVRHGHWFDKLRREWQMYRSFQTAVSMHRPDAIFILGDIFDEGLWCGGDLCNDYLQRFESLFSTLVPIYVVLGNHDVGFHYVIEPRRLKWFNNALNSEDVRLLIVKGNIFVLINSMAMERDGCRLCHEAEQNLLELGKRLECLKMNASIASTKLCSTLPRLNLKHYVQPILMQHFPLFRTSDANCSEPDEALPKEKFAKMRPNWDCLSEESTNFVLDTLKPRAVFGGHTHFGCLTFHQRNEDRIPEYSVSSFSWRNTNRPAFLLATFSPTFLNVSKCLLPQESTVIHTYFVGGMLLLIVIVWRLLPRRRAAKVKL